MYVGGVGEQDWCFVCMQCTARRGEEKRRMCPRVSTCVYVCVYMEREMTHRMPESLAHAVKSTVSSMAKSPHRIPEGLPLRQNASSSGLLRSKMRTIFSMPPVMTLVRFSEKWHVRTICLCWKRCSSSPVSASHTRAVKSADAVSASSAGLFSFAAHTAPLCPSKVPIQSPVSPFLSIGFPSLLALTRK